MAPKKSTMSERYPIAVIGAGPAGLGYIRHLNSDHRLEVVGFTNRNEERRAEATQKTKLPGFSNLKELLAGVETRPLGVVIATANSTHHSFALKCLAEGLHVFCEKPMAMNLEDAREMVEAEKASEGTLQIAFEYRYGTMTDRITELQSLGHFGDLKHLTVTDSRGHWLVNPTEAPEDAPKLDPHRGGGPLIHCGIHELDLMRCWAGEVEKLQAFVSPHSIPWYPAYCPDQMTLQVKFTSGCVGAFHLYHSLASTWYHNMPNWVPNYPKVPGHGLDVLISGSAGCAMANIYKEDLHLARYDEGQRDTVFMRTETYGHHPHDATHHNMPGMALDYFLRIRDGKGVLHSAEDSLRTTELGLVAQEAVDEAIASGWNSGVKTL